MSYRLEFSEEARKSLRALPGHYRQRARRLIHALSEDPRPAAAQQLRDNPHGYRIWLERWRIIYRVHDAEQLVFIAAVRLKKGPETYQDIPWN
jgi:mRNA interferase RelE/StbE